MYYDVDSMSLKKLLYIRLYIYNILLPGGVELQCDLVHLKDKGNNSALLKTLFHFLRECYFNSSVILFGMVVCLLIVT